MSTTRPRAGPFHVYARTFIPPCVNAMGRSML
jgi:hypothetical protein